MKRKKVISERVEGGCIYFWRGRAVQWKSKKERYTVLNQQPRVPKGSPDGGQWVASHTVNGVSVKPTRGMGHKEYEQGLTSKIVAEHQDAIAKGAVTVTKAKVGAHDVEIHTDFRGNVSYTSFVVGKKRAFDAKELRLINKEVHSALFKPAGHAPAHALAFWNARYGD